MRDTICAVAVTFNRLALLADCIGAIRAQTRSADRILVINNGSSDGTEEWLGKQTDIVFISQHNSGGAGGFHTGIRTAHAEGYDWIWVMDDDGMPMPDCLANLLAAAESTGYGLLSPVAVRQEDPGKLSFELRGSYDLEELRSECPRVLPDWALPFNGTLIARDTVSRVGLPKKEMFIWGDEVEYYLRRRKMDIRCASVLDALHVHPPDRAEPKSILGGLSRVKTPSKDREHIFFRNIGYIYPRYLGLFPFLVQIAEYSIYLLFYQRSARRWLRFLRYFTDGALNRYRLPI